MASGREKFLGFERRQSPRLNEIVFVIYRLESEGSGEFNKAFTKNISGNGLMLETETNIPQGTELELELYQPIKRSKITILCIPTLAKAVWTRNIEKKNFEQGENRYRVGIEFLEIKEEDRQRITQYVEEVTS